MLIAVHIRVGCGKSLTKLLQVLPTVDFEDGELIQPVPYLYGYGSLTDGDAVTPTTSK